LQPAARTNVSASIGPLAVATALMRPPSLMKCCAR
jgi:hypothetical protein